MTGLLRSELRKVTGTRLALGLLLGALGIVLLAISVTLWGPATPGMEVGGPTTVASAGDVVELLGVASAVTLFALLFGVTFATGEFRHHTAATTFVVQPRRWRVMVAKGVAATIVGVVYAVVALGTALAVVWVYTLLEGLPLPMGGEVWTLMGMTVAATMVNAVLGVGVGACLRSQVGAIVAVLVWLFVVEGLLTGLLPELARWSPFAAGNAMVAPTPAMGALLATVVAVAYAAAALAGGTWLTETRDTP